MPTYRVLPFRNERDALTLDNPLDPMPRGDCAGINEARILAKDSAEKAGADFVAIEDNKGDIIERWRRADGEWRRFNA
jgi:hypothetical protein